MISRRREGEREGRKQGEKEREGRCRDILMPIFVACIVRSPMGCGLTGKAVCPRAGLEVEGFESLSEQQLPPNGLLKGKSYSCVILQRSLGVLGRNLTSGLWSMKQV